MAEIGRLFDTPSSAGGGRGGFVYGRSPVTSAGSASSGASSADITKAVQAALAPPAAAATPTVNTAAPNPISNDAITALQGRVTGDMGAGAALDRGIQDIRARASLGIAREQELNAAARGMSGSSIPGSQAQDLAREDRIGIAQPGLDARHRGPPGMPQPSAFSFSAPTNRQYPSLGYIWRWSRSV